MKFTLKLMAAIAALMLVLSGCGTAGTKTPASGTAGAKAEEKKPAEMRKLTADEVLSKSLAASQKAKNYASDMTMNQVINDGKQKIHLDSTINMKIQQKPLLIKQKMKMKTSGLESAGSGAMNSVIMNVYLNDKNMYISNPSMKDEWYKMSLTNIPNMNGMPQPNQQQMRPEDQLKQLKKFSDKIVMKEEGNNYILTLTSNGKDLDKLVSDLIPNNDQLKNQASQITIKKFAMIIHINKETFLQDSFKANTEMELTTQGQKVDMTQNMDGTIKDYNKVEKLEIPKDVMENAVDMNGAGK